MARLQKGLLGGISGIIGPIEGYQLNGQYIIRSRRIKSKKVPTAKQLSNRMKMRLINQLLGVCAAFIKVGFAAAARGQTFTAYNAAMAYQLKHAVAGSYPDLFLDYGKTLLSTGPLLAHGLNATMYQGGQYLYFNWAIHSGHGNDHVMLLAYCPEYHEAVYELCGAKRIAGIDTLQMPAHWQGKNVYTWLSFVAENSTVCMNSVYMGKVLILGEAGM